MKKQEAVTEFEECWRECLRSNPHIIGDYYAQLEAWNVYVDGLNKSGLVTDRQAFEWVSPVRKNSKKQEGKHDR